MAYRSLRGSRKQPKPVDNAVRQERERKRYETLRAEVTTLSTKFHAAIRTGNFNSVQQDHPKAQQLLWGFFGIPSNAQKELEKAIREARDLRLMSLVVQSWQCVQVTLEGPCPILVIRADTLNLKWSDFQKTIEPMVNSGIKDLRICVEGNSVSYTESAIFQYL